MRIDYMKLANHARRGFCVLFGALAILGSVAICMGNFLHVVTTAGCLAMVYMTAKQW